MPKNTNARETIAEFLERAAKTPSVRKRTSGKRTVYEIYAEKTGNDVVIEIGRKELVRRIVGRNGKALVEETVAIAAITKASVTETSNGSEMLKISLPEDHSIRVRVEGMASLQGEKEAELPLHEGITLSEPEVPISLDDGVTIYTDGSCSQGKNKDRIGAWTFVIVKDGKKIAEACTYKRGTTSHEMEYLAVLYAIKATNRLGLKEYTVCTDFQSIVNRMTTKECLKRSRSGEVIGDITDRVPVNKLVNYIETTDASITWLWIKGHAETEWNNYCDRKARGLVRKIRSEGKRR